MQTESDGDGDGDSGQNLPQLPQVTAPVCVCVCGWQGVHYVAPLQSDAPGGCISIAK